MLPLAAYKLEALGLQGDALVEARAAVDKTLDSWLLSKGTTSLSDEASTFLSQTSNQRGELVQSLTQSRSGNVREVRLTEPTKQGFNFITYASVVSCDKELVVFLTLAAATPGSSVLPVITYPRCPSLVKNLLTVRSDWTLGGSEVPPAQPIHLAGKDSASTLVRYLRNKERTLPVTVVSELDGEPIWPELPEKLAADLAGLSTVVRIDAEASWTLNELLGKVNSCYLGAVRVYWPVVQTTTSSNDPRSIVWTAGRILSDDADSKGLARFTTNLRRNVMSVAALSIEPPQSIRRIKSEHSREQLDALKNAAGKDEVAYGLAESYLKDVERLKDELAEAKTEIARQAARADTAEHAVAQIKSSGQEHAIDVAPDEQQPPVPGEIRFYKKTYSTRSYDVLVRISDCGHHSWQASNKADKAKKGLERLEGRGNWKSVQHCGSCSGGGVWRVVW